MRVHVTAELDLAEQLGMGVDRFVELFGAGWRRVERSEPAASEITWFVAGEPPQLMLAPSANKLRLARPRGRWHGVAELRLEPVDERILQGAVDMDIVHESIADLLRRRRSSFRYCPYCRGLTPSELWEEGACMSCSERWLGAVH